MPRAGVSFSPKCLRAAGWSWTPENDGRTSLSRPRSCSWSRTSSPGPRSHRALQENSLASFFLPLFHPRCSDSARSQAYPPAGPGGVGRPLPPWFLLCPFSAPTTKTHRLLPPPRTPSPVFAFLMLSLASGVRSIDSFSWQVRFHPTLRRTSWCISQH